MKIPKDTDPSRWRDLPSGQSEIETEIGRAAAAAVEADAPPDDLRLAQLRQRLASRLAAGHSDSRRRAVWFLRPSFRIAGLVAASLAIGGVATAVSGRLIARYQADKARAAAAASRAKADGPSRRGARRWRVAVSAPAKLDLTVDSEGIASGSELELSVIEGRAELRRVDVGAGTDDTAGTVGLAPGTTWRSDAVEAAAPARPVGADAVPAAPREPAPAVAETRVAPPRPVSREDHAREGRGRERGERSRTVAIADPARDRSPREVGSHSPPAFSPPSSPPLPGEAALLARALRRLRTDRDPRAALAQIDEHDRRFPAGALGREAALARVEALLVLERKASALAILDALALGPGAVDRPAALARAELRAAGGRWPDAIADFDVVLGDGTGDDLAARALFGRAMARARSADNPGARDDLRDYLRRFTDGRRRNQAERALRRLGD